MHTGKFVIKNETNLFKNYKIGTKNGKTTIKNTIIMLKNDS